MAETIDTQMNRSLLVIVIISLISCGRDKKQANASTAEKEIEPFELTVTNFDYSLAYGIAYRITHKDLRIIFKGELEGEKDTTLYESRLKKSAPLKNVGKIEFDKLNDRYLNPCIADGSQINVRFQKGENIKSVHLSNYYQEDIGKVIYLINQLVPSKYQIHYDKKELHEDLKKCQLME
ncbi:hypothetical protein [Spongiimicrobium sp. 2-473A-2-J]|uniref:hypothetical protein n=1 Tax=Eudoraea algarum TaxID=3417568 RepID=UPI003D35E637